MNSKSLRPAPCLLDAKKMVPLIAPKPIKLLIYPKVVASPLKITLANTGNKVS